MAFLFQDQNQGTRNDKPRESARGPSRPFSFIRTLTVGLGFAPNLLTLLTQSMIRKSGNRFSEKIMLKLKNGKKALAGLGDLTLTAGGEFRPALRTSAARTGNLKEIMTNDGGASKRLCHGKSACPHSASVFRRAFARGNLDQHN